MVEIDALTRDAAGAFLERARKMFPVQSALLFGSRARNEGRADSDADVAVILSGKPDSRYKAAGGMAAIAFDVMQETGVLVDPLPIWEDEFNQPRSFANPTLIEAIKREGVRL